MSSEEEKNWRQVVKFLKTYNLKNKSEGYLDSEIKTVLKYVPEIDNTYFHSTLKDHGTKKSINGSRIYGIIYVVEAAEYGWDNKNAKPKVEKKLKTSKKPKAISEQIQNTCDEIRQRPQPVMWRGQYTESVVEIAPTTEPERTDDVEEDENLPF